MITDADLAAQQERLHETIADLAAKVTRLRASHDALLAACQSLEEIGSDEIQGRALRTLAQKIAALRTARAAIAQGERV